MENNTTMTYNCDEQTNHDLPGEINEWTADPADQQFHDEDWRQWDGTLSNEYEDEARSALVWGDEDWRQWDGTAEDGDS